MYLESGYRSSRDTPMKDGMKTLKAYRNVAVKPRDTDDPKHDSDKNYSYNFKDTKFSINGITRFAAHNGTMEVACDAMLLRIPTNNLYIYLSVYLFIPYINFLCANC